MATRNELYHGMKKAVKDKLAKGQAKHPSPSPISPQKEPLPAATPASPSGPDPKAVGAEAQMLQAVGGSQGYGRLR